MKLIVLFFLIFIQRICLSQTYCDSLYSSNFEINHKPDSAIQNVLNEWQKHMWKIVGLPNTGCGFMQCDGIRISFTFYIDQNGKACNAQFYIYKCRYRKYKYRTKRKLEKSIEKLIFPEESRGRCHAVTYGSIWKC
jgi:hypothetical protein